MVAAGAGDGSAAGDGDDLDGLGETDDLRSRLTKSAPVLVLGVVPGDLLPAGRTEEVAGDAEVLLRLACIIWVAFPEVGVEAGDEDGELALMAADALRTDREGLSGTAAPGGREASPLSPSVAAAVVPPAPSAPPRGLAGGFAAPEQKKERRNSLISYMLAGKPEYNRPRF